MHSLRLVSASRVLTALAIFLGASLARAAPQADMVFVNGAVYTADSARSWASALVVSSGRITYVGEDAPARALAGSKTRIVDLKGRMLLPAFQDSHVHPADAPNPATALDLHGLLQRERVLERIGEYARAHPDKRWIVGEGWDEAAFLPSGQPTRQMLDAVLPDRPAFLENNSGHEAWANSRALAQAGITERTPDPLNGRIERDEHGVPTGALQEEAMELVRAVVPPPTAEERAQDLLAALHRMSALGITALEDAAVTPEIAQAYATLERRGQLDLRANLCQVYSPSAEDAGQLKRFTELRRSFTGRRLSASCVKIFLDGAYGSHTLVLLAPYSDEPERFGSGKLFVDQDRLDRLVSALDAADFQVHMHAQGDGAVRAGLNAIAEARRANGERGTRHTLAHLALIADEDVPRFRKLGVVANMTPLWSLDDPWETVFAPRLFGSARFAEMYRTRTLLDSGAVLVWGTDWPVTGVSPLDGIETATTHRYPGGRGLAGQIDQSWKPEERVSLEQALVAYTSSGAYLLHEEAQRGSLTAGKQADLVVLDRNLFDSPALEIHAAHVDMTVFDGRIVYERAGADR